MSSGARRVVLLGVAMLLVFIAVAAVLLRLVPGPRKETDYLVIGTLATFASLVVLFVVLITSYIKDPARFFKGKDN
jgi:hypothetical protein